MAAALLCACTGARTALSLGIEPDLSDMGTAVDRPPFCVPSWSEVRRLEAGPPRAVALAAGPHGFWLARETETAADESAPIIVALDEEGRELGRSGLDIWELPPDIYGHVLDLYEHVVAIVPTPSGLVVIWSACGGGCDSSSFVGGGINPVLFAQAFDSAAAPAGPSYRVIAVGPGWDRRTRAAWAGDRVVLMTDLPVRIDDSHFRLYSMCAIHLGLRGEPMGDRTPDDYDGVPSVEPHVTEFSRPELLAGDGEVRIVDARDGAIAVFAYRVDDWSITRISTLGYGDAARVIAASDRTAVSGAHVVWAAADTPGVLVTLDGYGRASTEFSSDELRGGLTSIVSIGAQAILAQVWLDPSERSVVPEFRVLDAMTGTVIDRRREPFGRSHSVDRIQLAADNERAAIVGTSSAGDLVFLTVGCAD